MSSPQGACQRRPVLRRVHIGSPCVIPEVRQVSACEGADVCHSSLWLRACRRMPKPDLRIPAIVGSGKKKLKSKWRRSRRRSTHSCCWSKRPSSLGPGISQRHEALSHRPVARTWLKRLKDLVPATRTTTERRQRGEVTSTNCERRIFTSAKRQLFQERRTFDQECRAAAPDTLHCPHLHIAMNGIRNLLPSVPCGPCQVCRLVSRALLAGMIDLDAVPCYRTLLHASGHFPAFRGRDQLPKLEQLHPMQQTNDPSTSIQTEYCRHLNVRNHACQPTATLCPEASRHKCMKRQIQVVSVFESGPSTRAMLRGWGCHGLSFVEVGHWSFEHVGCAVGTSAATRASKLASLSRKSCSFELHVRTDTVFHANLNQIQLTAQP